MAEKGKHVKEKTLDDMATNHEGGLYASALTGLQSLAAGDNVPTAVAKVAGAYVIGRGVQSLRRFKKGGPKLFESPTGPEVQARHNALNDKQNWDGK